MRRSRYFGAALLGLLVVAAISVAAGSGRKPPMEQQGTVSLRRLSSSEVMTIFDKYSDMVSGEPAHLRGNEVLARLYPLSEMTAAPLKRAFPNVRFFKGLNFDIHPPMPYVMAIAGHKRYPMPGGLNQLLVDSDVRVTDANLVEIAKAAVILALGEDMLGNPRNTGYVSDELLAFPKITSLSAEMQVTGESHVAKLTVRIGDSEESWYVHRWHDQLGWMSRENANGLIKDYDMPQARPLKQRGQLVQSMDILTVAPSCAYVELELGWIPHYYVIVENNAAATGDSVAFSFAGFSPNATNVCVRVVDAVRSRPDTITRFLDTVQINGQGTDTSYWKPST
jgi:hypothetical protein